MNAHIETAIEALRAQRGDEVERFIDRYGTPDTANLSGRSAPEGWWDAPCSWNTCDTPREYLARITQRQAKYAAAIDYLIGLQT